MATLTAPTSRSAGLTLTRACEFTSQLPPDWYLPQHQGTLLGPVASTLMRDQAPCDQAMRHQAATDHTRSFLGASCSSPGVCSCRIFVGEPGGIWHQHAAAVLGTPLEQVAFLFWVFHMMKTHGNALACLKATGRRTL